MQLFSVLTLPIGILVMRFISENHKVQFCSLLTGEDFFSSSFVDSVAYVVAAIAAFSSLVL